MANRWDETWHRLREWTSGQTPSERLAAQILLSQGYEDLDPSHPLGGSDGRKDALCRKDNQKWIMAVYFPRGQKSFGDIKGKFLDDLKGVKLNKVDALAFVTNQELRLAEREELRKSAEDTPVEVFHLEKITAILDRPEMHDVRRQFLQIDFSEEEKATSVRHPLRLDIQQDCKLLQQLLDQKEQNYLTEKWQSCLKKNRVTWRDIPSRTLLIQYVKGELIQYVQDFYERLDSIEEMCRKLLELKLMIQPLAAKPKYGDGVLCFKSISPPAWAEKYLTIEDESICLNAKKINAMSLMTLKKTVQTTLDLGNQILDQLSLK